MVLARIVRSKGRDKVAVLNKQLFASADRPLDGNGCLRALLDLKLTIIKSLPCLLVSIEAFSSRNALLT